ncbi:MAG: FGGY-family carbohydrate kinase, partial [Candidatus Bipolaricaulota bacterium]
VMDGGARSDLWCTILASVLRYPMRRPRFAHVGSALGVALVAGVGVQSWDWDIVRAMQGGGDVFHPDPATALTYGRLYDVYRRTYEQLRTLYPILAES